MTFNFSLSLSLDFCSDLNCVFFFFYFFLFVFVGIFYSLREPFYIVLFFCFYFLNGRQQRKFSSFLETNEFFWIFLERFLLTNLLLTLFFYMFLVGCVIWKNKQKNTWSWMLNWPKKVCHNLISMDRRIWELPQPPPLRIHPRKISCRFLQPRNWAMPLLWLLPQANSTSIRWVWFFFLFFHHFFGFSWIFF